MYCHKINYNVYRKNCIFLCPEIMTVMSFLEHDSPWQYPHGINYTPFELAQSNKAESSKSTWSIGAYISFILAPQTVSPHPEANNMCDTQHPPNLGHGNRRSQVTSQKMTANNGFGCSETESQKHLCSAQLRRSWKVTFVQHYLM